MPREPARRGRSPRLACLHCRHHRPRPDGHPYGRPVRIGLPRHAQGSSPSEAWFPLPEESDRLGLRSPKRSGTGSSRTATDAA